MLNSRPYACNLDNINAFHHQKRSLLFAMPALPKQFSFFRFFLMSGLLAITIMAQEVSAQASNPPGTYILGSIFGLPEPAFYAYMDAGETLDLVFTKNWTASQNTQGLRVDVEGPGGITANCEITVPATDGDTCVISGLTSASDGIWRIETQFGTGGAANRYTWQIDVSDGAGSVDGRVWAEHYFMQQLAAEGFADFTFWYQSPHGYTYQASYGGFNGINSAFLADATGVRYNDTCTSAYASIVISSQVGETPDPDRSMPDLGECGDPYKIFFEEPAPDLPATAPRWDGNTDWILPPIAPDPAITEVTFTPDGVEPRSGSIGYEVDNFTGQLLVEVDTNDDGVFDVAIPGSAVNGSGSVYFDGLDGNDDPISAFLDMAIRVSISQVGEIHFVNLDVEVRSDGIEVIRLNGPDATDATLYWNDTELSTTHPCGNWDPTLDATGGINSTGGVHWWDADGCDGITGGWGDARAIDEWTFVPVDESMQIVVAAEVDIEINLTGGPCWRMLSSPVQDLTYAGMLADIWTQGATGSDHPGGEPNIYTWDVAGQDWAPVGDLNAVIPPGSGFIVSVFDLTDFDDPDSNNWPKSITIPAGFEHTAPLQAPMGGAGDEDWVLLGNPFQSGIDTDELSLNASNLTDAYYVYDRNTGGWVSTAGGFGELTDGAITTGQGFFVQAGAADPSLSFTEDSKTTGGQFYGKQQDQLRDFVRFQVRGEELTNSMWVRFSSDGSFEHTRGDALKLEPLAEQYALLASRKADGALTDIGHYPVPDENLSIPVSFQATRPGTYTITATDLDLPAGTPLWFTDLNTGQSLPLEDGFEYTFTLGQAAKAAPLLNGITPCQAGPQMAKTPGDDRFVISTREGRAGGELPSQVALAQNYPNPFNPATIIRYELPAQSQVRLEVFDMAGRRVATLVEGSVQAGVHTINFDASHLSSGVYLYTLHADGVALTRKLTLIK